MEDKIEVGEYVRTPLGIAKYLGECDDMQNFYEFDKLDEELWFGDIANVIYQNELDKVILKHSPNIIDLIEVGDYVNGSKVRELAEYDNKIEWLDIGETEPLIMNSEEIKSIATKEQFEEIEYKL